MKILQAVVSLIFLIYSFGILTANEKQEKSIPPGLEDKELPPELKDKLNLPKEDKKPEEKPYEKLKKHRKNLRKKPQKTKVENTLVNKNIKNPREFIREYNLKGDAEILVTIFDENKTIVNSYVLSEGSTGTKRGKNRLILWDGKDIRLENAKGIADAKGIVDAKERNYTAVIEVKYKDDTRETITLELKK